jgi:citrate lyase subunit beta / citryl-CoA lyase
MRRGQSVNDLTERTELLVPGPAEALGTLLDIAVPDLDQGASLPLLWHWVYLLERPAQADLGPDGHPVRGTLPAPPGPGRRRMWAGGQVRTSGPLRCGEPATRRSRVLSARDKQGRSGPLTFIVMQHQILQRGQVVIDERQDLVYREGPSGPPARPGAEAGSRPEVVPRADDEWQVDVSPVLLFRFSALTYNALPGSADPRPVAGPCHGGSCPLGAGPGCGGPQPPLRLPAGVPPVRPSGHDRPSSPGRSRHRDERPGLLRAADRLRNSPERWPVTTDAATARTLLFVPGDRPDRFGKAAAAGADLVILDLEDAVAADRKHLAREYVRAWLGQGNRAAVRINGFGTPGHADDVAMITGRSASLPAVMMPKAESPVQLAALAAGLPAGTGIIPLVETSTGVLRAADVCAAPGVVRPAFGSVDLATQLGVDHRAHAAFQHARSMLVLAAAAAGCAAPIDGVTTAIADEASLRTDLDYAVALGFTGKLCIHPRQVALANQYLSPSAAELEWAHQVLAAGQGDSARALDGQMIDRPVVLRAQAMVARASLYANGESAADRSTDINQESVRGD